MYEWKERLLYQSFVEAMVDSKRYLLESLVDLFSLQYITNTNVNTWHIKPTHLHKIIQLEQKKSLYRAKGIYCFVGVIEIERQQSGSPSTNGDELIKSLCYLNM